MFRNLQIYRLPAPWPLELATLADALEKKHFVPCGSQDRDSLGWASPICYETLVHSVGGQWLIALCQESRLLPASVVKQVADDRAADIEAEQGYKPGRKQMKALREAVAQELLPRAFTRRSKLFAWIDPVNGWLAVDAPSAGRAEPLIETLRDSLGSLPLALVRTQKSPGAAMADWLAAGEANGAFTIDQDCELHAMTGEKSAVRYMRHTLDSDEVRAHLGAGKLPTRLALTFEDRVSFVLTEKLEIKRLQFLDVVKEEAAQSGNEDARAIFDASFALMTGELRRLLPELIAAMGGEVAA